MKYGLTLKPEGADLVNDVQTSDRCFIARESIELSKVGKQMTAFELVRLSTV